MAVPFAPYTFTDGIAGDVNAARLNAIGTAVKESETMPAARVYRSTTQAITTATETAISFDTERFDQAFGSTNVGQWSVSPNPTRLTASIAAGIYLVVGHLAFAASAAGTYRIALLRHTSGATVSSIGRAISGPVNTAGNGLTVSAIWPFALNDYVELTAFQDTGANLNTQAGTATNAFTAELAFTRIA
jgi:hypothetical protein